MVIRIKDLVVSRTNYKFVSHVAPGVHMGIDPFNVLTPVLRVSSLFGDSRGNSLQSSGWASRRI